MLVLSRKTNQRLLLSEQIEIIVLRKRGDRVTLGFQAPLDVAIRRAEIPRRRATKESDALDDGSMPLIAKPHKSAISSRRSGEIPPVDE